MPTYRQRPLLSICIPVYNGAPYMGNVLRALLPQAAMFDSELEVVVADDCSSDRSAEVIAEAGQWGPMRYLRNETNIGMAPNIVNCLTKHATGEYVWIWSQHCLLHCDALARVMDHIKQHQDLDACYVNFRCANYPEDWPDVVDGGYAGTYKYVSNNRLESAMLDRWESLLNVRTALCTQTYAHILKRSLAVAYWKGRPVGRDYGNGPDTFSQTATVAESMFGKPCVYVGDPVFTIFNGAQTWGSLESRARVYLQGLPDLVRIYERLGWSSDKVIEAQEYASTMASRVIGELLQAEVPDRGRMISTYIFRYWRQSGAVGSTWRSFVDSECCWPARLAKQTSSALQRWHRYWFYNCRPARWLRARKS